MSRDLLWPSALRLIAPIETRQTLDQRLGCIDLLYAVRDSCDQFVTDNFRNREIARSVLEKAGFEQLVIATTIPVLGIIKSGLHDSEYAKKVNGFNWEEFFYSTEGFFAGFVDFLREKYQY